LKKIFYTYFNLLIVALLLAGCAKHQLTTRYLKDHERLLKKNELEIKGNKALDKEDLLSYVRQKPNRAILFGTWRLGLQWANLRYNPNKDPDEKHEAVILDSNLISRSEQQLKIHLQNLGYYNAVVNHEIVDTKVLGVDKWKTKKSIVKYVVAPGSPVIIDSIGYNVSQSDLKGFYLYIKRNRTFQKGQILKLEQLQSERERIVKDFQNRGYYKFAENYISFDVDTGLAKKKTIVITKIKQPRKTDSLHRRYKINNIYIQTDYDPYAKVNTITDSTEYEGVTFLSNGKSKFKPNPLYRSLFFHEGEFYNQKMESITYRQFSNLGMFSYIKIKHKEIVDSAGNNLLDVVILLNPASKMSISTEIMGIYREGFGLNGQILFTNKNAFKGSEILSLSLSGGFEDLGTEKNRYATNIGPRLSVTFPRLFLFKRLNNKIRKNAFPKTTISSYFNYQKRTQYTRFLTNASMKYDWNEGKYKKHEISISDINFSFVTKDSEILFDFDKLSPQQRFKFEDAISSGIKYAFTYNNQSKPKVKNSDYLLLKGQLVGPTAIVVSAFGGEQRATETKAITLWGVRYATFVKAQIDYRKYFNFKHSQQIAVRSFFGFGVPLDKHGVIPFDQLYYSGGANSIRGWRQRTLGPGSFVDKTNIIDRLGEIKIEANIEYRFPITSIFNGAAFIDAGNVWTQEGDEDTDDFDPDFQFDRFYKEIAVSPGLGVRFDFDFFLFRFDVGVPLKQPHKRTLWKMDYEQTQLNFGVGYPF
jgi:outer membrane protein assembly factor BamA